MNRDNAGWVSVFFQPIMTFLWESFNSEVSVMQRWRAGFGGNVCLQGTCMITLIQYSHDSNTLIQKSNWSQFPCTLKHLYPHDLKVKTQKALKRKKVKAEVTQNILRSSKYIQGGNQ